MILDIGRGGRTTQCDRCGAIFNDRSKRITLKAHLLMPEHDETNTHKTKNMLCAHLCPECYEWLRRELT